MLHKALDDTVLWGQVPRNVSDGVTLPRISRHEIKPLNREQARQLLDVAHEHHMEALLTAALPLVCGAAKYKDAGLPHMRFHDLRHSTATILLTMGVHPKVVQELLGHTNISLTMDTYSHVLPSMQRNAMDDFFGE